MAVVEQGRLKTAKKKYSDSSKEMAKKMTKQLFPKGPLTEGSANNGSSGSGSSGSGSSSSGGIIPTADVTTTNESAEKVDEKVVSGVNEKVVLGVDETVDHDDAASAATDVTGKIKTSKPEPPRAYSVFMLLFTSLAIVVVSIFVAFFAAGTQS